MDFFEDTLVTGLTFVLAGAGAVLAALPGRHSVAERIAACLLLVFLAAPMAGFDIPVPWAAFSEICLGVGILFFLTALVQYGRRELAEGEYD